MTEITYTNTIPEIRRASLLFWRKYKLPRTIIMTLLFGLTFYFGIDFIMRGQYFAGYALALVSPALIITRWADPFMRQKRIIKAIEAYGCDEKYTARLYDDRIEIDTVVLPEDAETEIVALSTQGVSVVENPELLEEAKAQLAEESPPETSVYGLGAERLCSAEDGELFCLFVNKALFHIFPKRCLTQEQIQELQNYFKDKAI
jgi:hypothetical protein